MRPIQVVPTVLLLAAAAGPAAAQAPAPGDRVRLMGECGDGSCRVTGTLATLRPDSVTVASGRGTTTWARGALRRVEVSEGRRSYRLAGALVGLAAGAVGTYAILNTGGSTAPCDRDANQDAMGSGECLAITAGGALAGAGLGALVGGLIRSERWREVPVNRLGVGVGPVPGRGLGFRVRASF